MRKALHIVVLLAALALVSCRGPRMIPKDDLTDIYYDMFLLDQQIREDTDLRRQADTTLVYEAVFNKYGYDTDDYLYSLQTYLKDPERFARVLEDVSKRFQDQAAALDKEISRLDRLAGLLKVKQAPVDSILSIFGRDSVYVGLPRVLRDSSRYGAWFRLTGVRADSLMVPADSLKADSLAVEPLAAEPAEKPVLDPGKPGEKPDLLPDLPKGRHLPPKHLQEEVLEVPEEVAEEVKAE
ncbi:MAG: DUF4296 domain-containing protein [Bacteroidales bacterium]|nr:DUF4296 domain-containing protein [Bacteroidales bacterium]